LVGIASIVPEINTWLNQNGKLRRPRVKGKRSKQIRTKADGYVLEMQGKENPFKNKEGDRRR